MHKALIIGTIFALTLAAGAQSASADPSSDQSTPAGATPPSTAVSQENSTMQTGGENTNGRSTASSGKKTAAPKPPEDKSKRPSPPGVAQVTLGGHPIEIDYSRPSMRGRKIYGGLVPFGKVWRTGANEATALTTDADITIGGVTIPKGSYTVYSLPDADKWQLIINKQTGQWGTVYDQKQDLVRIPMTTTSLEKPVEVFTMTFEKKDDATAQLNVDWESTRASVIVKLK